MIAYSNQWLAALQVRRQAAQWNKKELITDAQLRAIFDVYPAGFYTPNVFVRIGLGIFCWVLVCSAFGLLSIAAGIFTNERAAGILLLFFGVGTLAALEYAIREMHHYRSGLDDAMLYLGLGSTISGLCLTFSTFDSSLLSLTLALPLLAAAAVRYTDKLVAALAFVGVFAILFLLMLKMGNSARLVLPFGGMLFAGAGYSAVLHIRKQACFRLWEECTEWLEVLCLVTFYACGNYFVIREGSNALFGEKQVPLSLVFYVFTAVVPVVYVYFGLRKRNRILFRCGLLLVAVAVFTFRFYFSLGHTQLAVTLAGAVLVAFAFFTIRYLKKGNLPFTYIQEAEEEEGLELETLVINQTFAPAQAAPVGENAFGGGQFGGGGSGSSY